MNKKEKKTFYLYYSVIFVLIAGMIAFFYYSKGKTLVDGGGDGFRQHYRALLYYSEYLKTIISNFLRGSFSIPHWDFSIGEGNDIIHTFHYYCLGDIFTVLCLLFPQNKMYICYDLIIFLRLFFAGIMFAELCFYKNKKNPYLITACSLIYAFCPFCFASINSHVFFISAAVFFPAIILGIEHVINRDKSYILSIAVMLSSLSNIYFFYMNVVSTVIYVIFRMLFMDNKLDYKVKTLVNIGFFSIVGVMMGAILFMPMFSTMLSNSRLESKMNIPWFYSKQTYMYMLADFVYTTRYYIGGFTIFGLLSTIQLLTKKRNALFIILLITGFTFAYIPQFNRVFNAMASPTDRWLYAVSMLMCYIIVDCFENTDDIKNNSLILIVGVILFCAFCLKVDGPNKQIHLLFTAMAICLMCCIRFIRDLKVINYIILVTATATVLFNVVYNFSPLYWDLTRNGVGIEYASLLHNDEEKIIDSLEDSSFFRYSGDSLITNSSIHGNYSTTQYYWSVVNNNVVEFRKHIGLPDRSNHHYSDYDERFYLNALSGVKYYLNKNNTNVPYGFDRLKTIDDVSVYRNNYVLPLMYSYDSYILKDKWLRMSLAERNEAIVQSAVVDKEIDGMNNKDITLHYSEIDYSVDSTQGVDIENNVLSVTEGDAQITLNCSYVGKGEYYLVVEGLESNESSNMEVTYKNVSKTLYFKGKNNLHYSDRHDYLINIGYMEELDAPINIKIPNVGEYGFKDIKVIFDPIENQLNDIENFKQLTINELKVENDFVRAKLKTTKSSIICIAIPYSSGWSVFIDGEKTELINCNIQYLGVFVEPGEHTIELKYTTPLIKAGTLISSIGMVLTIYLAKKRIYKVM